MQIGDNYMEGNYETIIEPGKTDKQYWEDLWRYRELLYFLAWRDVLVRYKQAALGIAWSVIRPLLTMVVFTLVFGKLANLATSKIPYPIVVFAALLPWQFFSNSLSSISTSVVTNSNLISKIYFPRLIIPISSVAVNLIDFVLSILILIALMAWYKYVPNIAILTIPLFLALGFLAAIGFGTLIAALNVKYRDFNHIVPFIVQLGLYISPVGFSSDIVPLKWRYLYSLNPLVGVIDGFRWAIIGHGQKLFIPGTLISLTVTGITLILGLKYFRSTEKTFADII